MGCGLLCQRRQHISKRVQRGVDELVLLHVLTLGLAPTGGQFLDARQIHNGQGAEGQRHGRVGIDFTAFDVKREDRVRSNEGVTENQKQN
jgi:hypothetical protein